MKILFVKLGSIGDIVHTMPVLAAVRAQMPDAEIGWVVEKGSAEILRGNPLIDRLIEVDTRSLRTKRPMSGLLPAIREQLRTVRRHRYQVALDFQGLIKSAIIAKLSGARERYGFAKGSLREPAGRIFLTQTVEIAPQMHVIRKNLRLAEAALGIETNGLPIRFPIQSTPEAVTESEDLAQKVSGRFAILNPAGGWVTKQWSAANFGKLADILWEKHGLRSIVPLGPRDAALGNAVEASSRSALPIIARTSLLGFYELARRAAVYVGGDTGPTHLAVAAGAPVVGIFGPTEWWRNGSTNTADICVERTDIGCRVNCHRRTCSNWICMDIDVEAVAAAVEKRIGNY
ncbi:MAG TPA: lipopolysaccharide heptosyltransferase I [Pyrinomonadaceae bacterium]|nr:lipopolysaccharide heptosyltransferase I [Pyrinomonadaceae bacterium]